MSGPPFPPSPLPGSNAIGAFIIGKSPIGPIESFDVWKTIISQYANSPILTQLCENFNASVDQTANFSNLYDWIWNVDSAQGYGLDCWGRIVGVRRTLNLPGSVPYLGFKEAGSSWTGFGQGGFYSGGSISTNYDLSDADFRTLIYAKAAGNVSDGSIPALNQILLTLFPGRGKCYVQDNLNMSMVYVFEFALSIVELAILGQSGVLPTPCGVAVTIEQVP